MFSISPRSFVFALYHCGFSRVNARGLRRAGCTVNPPGPSARSRAPSRTLRRGLAVLDRLPGHAAQDERGGDRLRLLLRPVHVRPPLAPRPGQGGGPGDDEEGHRGGEEATRRRSAQVRHQGERAQGAHGPGTLARRGWGPDLPRCSRLRAARGVWSLRGPPVSRGSARCPRRWWTGTASMIWASSRRAPAVLACPTTSASTGGPGRPPRPRGPEEASDVRRCPGACGGGAPLGLRPRLFRQGAARRARGPPGRVAVRLGHSPELPFLPAKHLLGPFRPPLASRSSMLATGGVLWP